MKKKQKGVPFYETPCTYGDQSIRYMAVLYQHANQQSCQFSFSLKFHLIPFIEILYYVTSIMLQHIQALSDSLTELCRIHT